MYVLAIDPGRFTGYAVFRNMKRLMDYGTLKTKDNNRSGSPEQILVKDFTELMKHCKAFCDHEKINDRYIIVEDTFVGVNKKIAQIVIQQQSTVKSIGIQFGFEAHDVMATTWQNKMGFKHGRASVNKHEIWHWVKNEYPYFFGDEHAASAVCVGYYWMMKRNEEEVLKLL